MENFEQYPVGIQKVLTASEFMLFCTMFNQWRLMKNKESGYYFRSLEDLSNDCMLSCATIKRSLKSLKNKGVLENISGSKKKGHANEYRFDIKVIFSFINSNLANTDKKSNSDLIEDSGDCGDDLKGSICSNKNLNLSHHKELTKRDNILHKIDDHMDISSIPEKKLFFNTLEGNTKYMKDNKISRPDVNVVANNENNGMNDNTTNNNIQPLQVPASDTSDTSTVLLSGDGGIGGMVPSVEENNIQPVQVRTSDALDTPTVYASGNEGMEVVSDSTNSESTATNDVDTTHTTSEDNTIPTVNGTETLQHPTYSSAKPSKIYAKKGAAAVGGDFGAAQKSCETASNTPTVEQSPTSTEKVDNSQPSYSDTASNGEFDMFYAQYGCTREEYEEAQRSFHKSNWRSLPCKFNGQELTMAKVIDKFNEEYEEGKKPIETNTYFLIVDTLEKYAKYYERIGKMSQADTADYLNMVNKKAERYYTYWTKTFENRRPYEARPSEKKMYDLLLQMGRIGEKPLEKTDITSIPTVNAVDTDFEDEMAYLDFESGTMTKKHSTTA